MKKSIKLLSFLAITSLLSCTSEVIKQNVSIETKPTMLPVPNNSSSIKPSPSSSISPIPTETPKVEEKKYTSVVFSLNYSEPNITPIQETISEKPTFNNIKDELFYYNATTKDNPRNYKEYNINIDVNSSYKLNLQLIYDDGIKDNDYNIEIPEDYKEIIELKADKFISRKKIGLAYVKVSSKRNKNLFKFFPISIYVPNYYDYCCESTYIQEKTTFNGKIVDPSSVPVKGAKVSAKAIDPGVTWSGVEQIIENGSYIFKDAPVGARILITVTKDGWTTRQRTEVLKSNLTGDPQANKFDFDGIYAIQDEPEITSLKVNTKTATATGPSRKPNNTTLDSGIELSVASANLSGLDNNKLEVEMTFSEPVRKDDVENFFRIQSQNFDVRNKTNFTIDNKTSGVTWEWSNDDRTVLFKTNRPLLANTTGQEARYMVEFTQGFRDRDDKEARAGKYIRFNPANTGDFNIFSLKNDETNPQLLSIIANDGLLNDVIELKFSEPMEVLGRKADEIELFDPLAPTNRNRNAKIYQTSNTGNNATILGFSTVDNSLNLNDFRAVFTIGRLIKPISSNKKVTPLNIANSSFGNIINGNSIISAKITKDTVRFELPATAFNKGDQIILSMARTILGNYEDTSSGVSTFSINVDSVGVTNALVSDPAGKLFSAVNSSLGIVSNDLQKTTIVN